MAHGGNGPIEPSNNQIKGVDFGFEQFAIVGPRLDFAK